MSESPTVEERLKQVEDSTLISKTRFATLLAIGGILWTLIAGILSNQLEEIKAALQALQTMEVRISLLEYRLNQQDVFNSRLLQEELEAKRVLDEKFRRLEDQYNRTYSRGIYSEN